MKYGKLLHYHKQKQTVLLCFENTQLQLQVITPRIIRVLQKLDDAQRSSKAIEGDKEVHTDYCVCEKEDGIWVNTEELRVRVSDCGYIDFFDAAGNVLCADYRHERKPLQRISEEHAALLLSEGHGADMRQKEMAFQVVKAMSGSEHFYGLGDKTGFLDKRYYAYEMWNTDDPRPQVDTYKALYKSIPFFLTLTDSNVYGIFLDNTYHTYFDMGQESEDYFWFGSDGGDLDYYFIFGQNMPEVLGGYTYLTGTCPLPQKWALGYHQSRWGYVTQEDVQSIADGMRKNDIPCDVIHLDIDYMEHFKVFTWNEDHYHGDARRFLEQLAADGFKIVTINDPGVKVEEGYPVYEEGIQKDFFAKAPDGQVYVNEVWPGDAVFPDFGNPDVRKWWGDHQKFLLEHGVRGIWNDMNEPASFKGPLPEDVVFTDEGRTTDHAEIHNVYGHLMAKAAFEGLKKHDGRRPFVITRACYAGSQKYSTVWTGDNTSMWGHLQMLIPQLCNLGLSGMPFAGTDIGGFGADTTPELMARWIQAACFSPLMRNHSALGSRLQEPWQFGPEVLDIYRKYVKLRYRLIPYLYDLFFEGEKTGAPIMRPLVYHYEKDEAARVCNDEFMVGPNLLVAPVVHQGERRRMVYLPEGQWYDYWTREKIAGPCWFIREAPLDVCPIYVRAGSILPVMEDVSYVGQKEGMLLLDVFPGEGSWDHYYDNGEDYAYRQGAYHHYRFTVNEAGEVKTELLHSGYKPYEAIRQLSPDQTVQCGCLPRTE